MGRVSRHRDDADQVVMAGCETGMGVAFPKRGAHVNEEAWRQMRAWIRSVVRYGGVFESCADFRDVVAAAVKEPEKRTEYDKRLAKRVDSFPGGWSDSQIHKLNREQIQNLFCSVGLDAPR